MYARRRGRESDARRAQARGARERVARRRRGYTRRQRVYIVHKTVNADGIKRRYGERRRYKKTI